MALKLFESIYCNPSFLLTLLSLFLPYMYLSPIPGTETLYQQFIKDISAKDCHIPFGNMLPFINCTDSIECLSSAFKQCDTPVSIKPTEKTFLLCKEIFDNLNNIFCQNNYIFESLKEPHALSTEVCADFTHLNAVIPRKEQYLGSRLIDGIVCEVVCSNEFANLCKILLWSYEVQSIIKDRNAESNELDGNVEHILADQVGSNKGSVNGKMVNKQTGTSLPNNRQQQQEADMDSELKPSIGVGKKAMIVPSPFPHINIEQNGSTIKNTEASIKNERLNAIPGSDPNAEIKESSLAKPETGSTQKDKHRLNVKVMPNRITDSPEAPLNLPETRLSEKLTNVQNNQNAWGTNQEANNTVKKPTLANQHDDELKTVTGLDEEEIQVQEMKKDDISNGQNQNEKTQVSVDGNKNPISENNSHDKVAKPEVNGGSGVQGQNIGDVETNMKSQTNNADIENNMQSSLENNQTEMKGADVVNENKDSVADVPNKNVSDQKKLQEVTPKQDIKNDETQSNILNSKTSRDNVEFEQDEINTDTPLEKMDDSDIHQPHDQNQYNVAVYQHTKSNQPESKVADVVDIPTEIKNEFSKTFDGFASRTSNIRGSESIQVIPSFPEQEDSHFIFYFLSIVLILMVGYVIFHNKQKIIALIVEGRHERRRRSHGVGYKKLETK